MKRTIGVLHHYNSMNINNNIYFPLMFVIFFHYRKRFVLIIFPVILTMMICMMIIDSRDYLKKTLTNSTRLFQFCILYENNYYHNLLTFPIALVIILLIIINQTRKEYYRLSKEKFSIHIPIPYNPFSKTKSFRHNDFMRCR